MVCLVLIAQKKMVCLVLLAQKKMVCLVLLAQKKMMCLVLLAQKKMVKNGDSIRLLTKWTRNALKSLDWMKQRGTTTTKRDESSFI